MGDDAREWNPRQRGVSNEIRRNSLLSEAARCACPSKALGIDESGAHRAVCHRETLVVNRNALILRYKDPAIRWINEVDPSPDGAEITLASVNEERTVYLIDDRIGEEPRSFERWLRKNYGEIFEMELDGWYTDPTLWPQDRSLALFRAWFDVELHTVLVDLGTGEMYDDET